MTAITAKTKIKKNRPKLKTSTVLIYILFIFLVVLYIAPILWVGVTSLKTRPEIYKDPFGLPTELQWENFSFAWTA